MSPSKKERIEFLVKNLYQLHDGQIYWIEKIVRQFNSPYKFSRLKDSDVVSERFLQDFGDALRIHHCFSNEAFSKDKFEYVTNWVLNLIGVQSQLAPKGNPGHDITIENVRFSLKTQADKNIKRDYVHISKFMELGKGTWHSDEEDLIGLREQFFSHMKAYDRILTLRALSSSSQQAHYELVEIPKCLLEEAKLGNFEMKFDSTQTPKPGYCHIYDQDNNLKFELYFDGGTERKLQIKNLGKHYCLVHANWVFDILNP